MGWFVDQRSAAEDEGGSWPVRWSLMTSPAHFTLRSGELELLRNKTGATRLGFALLITFLALKGRFPHGRSDLPDNAIEFIAKQVGVAAGELGFYDWDGRQIKRHRSEIRRVTGFRECGVADADKLTAWLAEGFCRSERRPERVESTCCGDVGRRGSSLRRSTGSAGSWARRCIMLSRHCVCGSVAASRRGWRRTC